MKLSIRKKLIFSYVIVLALAVGVAAAGIWSNQRTAQRYTDIIKLSLPLETQILTVRAHMLERSVVLRDYILTQDEFCISEYESINESIDKALQAMDDYDLHAQSIEYRDAIMDFESMYRDMANRMFIAISDGSVDQAVNLLIDEETFANAALTDSINSWRDYIVNVNDEWIAEANRIARNGLIIIGICLVIALAAVIALTIILSKNIAVPVERIQAAADLMSMGDLTVAIPSIETGDEIEALNESVRRMTENLASLVREVQGTAEQVAGSSSQLSAAAGESAQAVDQIAATVQQMANAAEQESSSANETAAASEQIMASVNQVASGAETQMMQVKNTSELVDRMTEELSKVTGFLKELQKDMEITVKSAEEGNASVQEVEYIMNQIRQASAEVESAAKGLDESSRQIGQVVQVISDIADQTNLLALNAAIEAARAGEQGRGFAVVAEEVRKLAEGSLEETKTISKLIERTVADTGRVAKAIVASGELIEKSVPVVSAATASLEVIRKNAQNNLAVAGSAATLGEALMKDTIQVNQGMSQVVAVSDENAAAAQQMAAGMAEVQKSVENIAAISEENAASIEEVSASSEEVNASIREIHAASELMADMAHKMMNDVAKFKVA
ncbi:MAG TPA: methyl-accepting chemotaxis protein [Bacillota bacterium]|nr:methyl-accepting chemotaxis protein [Bacillota bacterium]HQD79739.1 methyl-accepting chemotaxis protein [Bacillota bacterium]